MDEREGDAPPSPCGGGAGAAPGGPAPIPANGARVSASDIQVSEREAG
jgi:hypothetical protein